MISNNSVAYPTFKSFSTQELFLAYQLLRFNGFESQISIEKIGDIGIEGDNSEIIELKNADSKGNNPLSNKSNDLWKTLYNWTNFFYNNPDFQISQFKLYLQVFSSNECPTDLVEDFLRCNNPLKFKAIKSRITKELLKVENYISKKLTIIENQYIGDKKSSNYYIEALLTTELLPLFEEVISKFDIRKDSDYLVLLEDLAKRIYGFKDENQLEDILIKYLGWIKLKISKSLKKNSLIVISTSEFNDFSSKYIAPLFDKGKYINHVNLVPSTIQVKNELESGPLYVKQLELVGFKAMAIENAAYCHLKTILERKHWIKQGYISNIDDPKYINYQNQLKRRWCIISETKIDKYSDNCSIGQEVYNQLIAFRGHTFDGEVLDYDINQGFIEEMANFPIEEHFSIGWHPRYKEIFEEKK